MTYGLKFEILVTNRMSRTIEVSINDLRYRYTFHNQDFSNVEYMTKTLMRSSPGRCLAWIKKNSTSWEKVETP
jgi:hypothetical protein